MKNTITNKSRFFALYWGQEVLFVPHLIWSGNPPEPSHEEWSEEILNDYWMPLISKSNYPIFLKSISAITDEDAIEVANVFLKAVDAPNEKLTIEEAKDMLNDCKFLPYQCVDYLRSRGYALPWMGISVKQQIQLGWIKLKSE